MQGKIHIVENVALAVKRVDMRCGQQRVDAGGGLARARGDFGRAGADIDRLHLRARAGVLDRAVEQYPAFIHDRDLIGELEHPVDVVLDQQHR
jgi:hypothetical protein